MRKSENGRSMVEMLGVLAIIGVLSVGGVYGYSMAMRNYRANEVAQTLSMLAVLARAANGGEGANLTLTASGLDTTIAGITLDGDTTVANGEGIGEGNIEVAFTISSGDTDGKVRSRVCAIVPTANDSAAGYHVTGCGANAGGGEVGGGEG